MFKRFIALAILVFIGVATYFIGSRLSADAIGMGVGVIFGVMAGIPTALLLVVSERNRHAQYQQQPPPPTPPPVVVFASPGTSHPERWIEGPTTIDAPVRQRSWAEVEDW